MLADSSFFLWAKHPPLTGKLTRPLWHLFKQYKTPQIKAFIRRTWKDGKYYSVCPAEYWEDNVIEYSNETPERAGVCATCWRVAKKMNLR